MNFVKKYGTPDCPVVNSGLPPIGWLIRYGLYRPVPSRPVIPVSVWCARPSGPGSDWRAQFCAPRSGWSDFWCSDRGPLLGRLGIVAQLGIGEGVCIAIQLYTQQPPEGSFLFNYE
jgi:hypothetical protein